MFLSFCVFQDNGKEQEKRKNLLKTHEAPFLMKPEPPCIFWCCNVLWPHKKHTRECYGSLLHIHSMNECYENTGHCYNHIHTLLYLPLLLDYILHLMPSMFSTFWLEWEYRPTFPWNFTFWLLQTILHVCEHFWQNRPTFSTHTFAHLCDKVAC